MTETNLLMIYRGMQFSTLVDVVDCEYTDCSAKTEKLFVIGDDVWQFCHPHASVVLNAFCRVEAKPSTSPTGIDSRMFEDMPDLGKTV